MYKMKKEKYKPNFIKIKLKKNNQTKYNWNNTTMSDIMVLMQRLLLGKQQWTAEHKKMQHLLIKESLTIDEKRQINHFLNHATGFDRQWLGAYMDHMLTDTQCLENVLEIFKGYLEIHFNAVVEDIIELESDDLNSWKELFLSHFTHFMVTGFRTETLVHNKVNKKILKHLNLDKVGQVAKALNSIYLRRQNLYTTATSLVIKAYSGKSYHGLTAQNLQLTADMTSLPFDLVHKKLKQKGVLTKTDRLKFCQAIPVHHISSNDYETPAFVYCIEINSMTCKVFQVGITENIQHNVDRLQNQPNVEHVRLHTMIDCSKNVNANPTGKRRLEAYVIQQTILAVFQPCYTFSDIIKDDDDTFLDDFVSLNEIEFLNDRLPIEQVCKVMKILANAIDEKRVIMNRQPSLDKKLCVDETNKCFYVDRDTLRQHLIEIAKTLCNENHVVLNPDCITVSDKEFMLPLTACFENNPEPSQYQGKVHQGFNLIRISLYESFEAQLRYIKSREDYRFNLNYDFSVAIISSVGELDVWRKENGLKAHDYLQCLRRYWDQYERLPQFMELIDGPEDDVTMLEEFIEQAIYLLISDEKGGEPMIDDKYRWPGPFYVSSFF